MALPVHSGVPTKRQLEPSSTGPTPSPRDRGGEPSRSYANDGNRTRAARCRQARIRARARRRHAEQRTLRRHGRAADPRDPARPTPQSVPAAHDAPPAWRGRSGTDRRDQLRHHVYSSAGLLASASNQLGPWDVTQPKAPTTSNRSHLDVILDVYSRYLMGWMVEVRERAALANELVAETIRKPHVDPNRPKIHSPSPELARDIAGFVRQGRGTLPPSTPDQSGKSVPLTLARRVGAPVAPHTRRTD